MLIPMHSMIMAFIVRWRQNFALFSSLRGMHEPYNYNQKFIVPTYFDFDIYKPAYDCLKAMLPHLTKESRLRMDKRELSGEAVALCLDLVSSVCAIRRQQSNLLTANLVVT